MDDKEFEEVEHLKYEVTEKENQLSNEYQINLEQSITSNGQMHLVNIKAFEMEASCSYFSVPKLNTSAFLLAEVYNWYQYDLLSGRANIFFEGAYVGKTNIQTNTTDDTLALSLGVDDDIQITRTPIKEKSGSKLLSFKKEITYTYKIEVLNTKKEKIEIEILDQIPITSNEDIEITFDNIEKAEIDNETGEISWMKTLNPGEKTSWYFTYSIRYPKSKLIKGTK